MTVRNENLARNKDLVARWYNKQVNEKLMAE